jgi:uncharacterized protein YbjT (DUF2867 family)
MILVVGATGLVGSDICRRLAARGDSVRALVRPSADPARVLALNDAGVETVEGDLRDRVSLDAACRDVSAVIETAAAMPFSFVPGINDILTTDIAGVESLFAAAETAGVTHAVYMSVSGQIDLDFPLRNAKRRIEERLRQSDLTHTILRPSFFMEAWLGPAVGFDAANATAVVYGDGTMPVSWVSSGDVAELTVRCLRNPAARDATIEMGGPEALPPLEVVRIFEEIAGRPFGVTRVPIEELAAQERAATDDMGRSFAGLKRCLALGDAIPMEQTVRTFGLDLTPVRAFAEATCAAVPAAVG